MRAGGDEYWPRVAELAAELPTDALALAADSSEVSCWWRERATAQDAVTRVDRLHETLQKLAEIQVVADANANLDDAADEGSEVPSARD
jgi:hypothetical protein